MKLVQVIYGNSIDDEVMETLTKLGIKKYTKVHNAIGQGGTADPHLNTEVWPGTNIMLMIVTDDDTKDRLLPALKALKEQYHRVGLKVLVSALEGTI